MPVHPNLLIYTIGVVQCELLPLDEMQCHGVRIELPFHWMKNNNSFIGECDLISQKFSV